MMYKYSGLVKNILVGIGLLLIAGVVYVMTLPADEQLAFQRENAAQDVVGFERYVDGEVLRIDNEQILDQEQQGRSIAQTLTIRLFEGRTKDTEVIVDHNEILDQQESAKYAVGDRLVLGNLEGRDADEFVIVDRYRLPGVVWGIGIFLVLVLFFGRWRGAAAFTGLGLSAAILFFFTGPQIVVGKDPVIVGVVSAAVISFVSLFVAHGFKARTRLAVISTMITFAVAFGLVILLSKLSVLFGLGTSEAFLLQSGFLGGIDLRGVLIAGVLISTVGVLDDITTAQVAAVEELHKLGSGLSWKKLYKKALSIGKEHIASLVNTLILVYAGTALPLFLLVASQSGEPLWIFLNSEFVAEELVRSLVGSTALIVAVPIATFLAAKYYSSKQNIDN